VPWPALSGEGFEVAGFFYGCNIHPEEEWIRRREAVECLAGIMKGRVEFTEYEPARWFERASGFRDCPEGGERCLVCFGLQLEASVEFARDGGFAYICTTLTISPHKDPDAINATGSRICEGSGVEWMPRVWRKNDGFKLSVARSREWGLYRQDYCGCEYSFSGRLARGDAEKVHGRK
jgi:predicted adenine nucleotide alpha hydrolase (AANH) superfamily ATPase